MLYVAHFLKLKTSDKDSALRFFLPTEQKWPYVEHSMKC